MTRIHRTIFLATFLGLVAVPRVVHGGESPEAPAPSTLGQVLTRLASERDAEVAWGAYLAGRDGHEDAVPALLDALRARVPSLKERQDLPSRLVRRSIFDALIRLEASVPAALLAEAERGFAIQALILRARDPQAHAGALLHRFQRTTGAGKMGLYEVAIGNLLLRAEAPGFAHRLVDRMPFRLRVRVYTPSPAFRGIGGGRSIGGGFGDAVAKVPEGFPPYAWYTIQADARRGARLLADGPKPVYMRRVERATSGLVGGGPSHRFDANGCRTEWAAALLERPPEALAFPSEDRISVPFSTPDAYVERVVRKRAQMTAPYWKLLRTLRNADLLTADEAFRAAPEVTVDTSDDRDEKIPPLPPIPSLVRPEDLRPKKTG